MAKSYKVTIRDCDSAGKERVSYHTDKAPKGAPDQPVWGWTAVDKAVRKHWGKRASFHRDNGSSIGRGPYDGTQYGQITVPIKGNSNTNTCITGIVSVKVER